MKKIAVLVFLVFFSAVVVPPVASAADWSVPGDFATINAAVESSSVIDGDRILVVGPGNFAGAYLSKRVEIKGSNGAVINAGPLHGSGQVMGFRLLTGSSGAAISHLTFKVDLAIMNGDGVSDVTITNNTFLNAVQAISNWRGNAWIITHNNIIDLRTRNGGGIGILIGDYTGGYAEDNVVAHNKISGVITSMPGELGGYNASGIVLYADFRWERSGATAISYNRVVNNKVGLISQSELVDVIAFEMTDTRNDDTIDPVILSNAIGYNDFRGTALQISLTPTNLDISNIISRNLGENRGHGMHPSAFGSRGN